MDSSGAKVIVKTISSSVGNTEKATGEMSPNGITSLDANGAASRKRKRLIERIETNKKLAHYDIEDTEIANCRLQITSSSERVLVQSQVNDGQQIDTRLVSCYTRAYRLWKVLDRVVDYLLGDLKKKLVFLWDLSHCTSSSVRSLENQHKFIVFKKLGNIWEGNGCYDESNTLLLDDSPYKALLNPVRLVTFTYVSCCS
ncbi:hypothetical protein L1987_68321 [Smallanthus sonchifolius]|uniref:Uncharacterized protein n=1 Tax=Smallanthus sonchifolius TaxID=185202 RepID=A0ACB9B604_9ASTR|nr:hypothetical protein L1987_68321 [Smallanthus sonchifolius]